MVVVYFSMDGVLCLSYFGFDFCRISNYEEDRASCFVIIGNQQNKINHRAKVATI